MARPSITRRTCASGSSRLDPAQHATGGRAAGRARDEKEDAMRRAVISGMGIVSSIGNNTQEVLASLREARSGVVFADKYKELGFRCQVHGAPDLDPSGILDRR